jgi:putative membrane protein
MYVSALANVDLSILIPMVGGLAVGAVAISFSMSWLFKRFYTASFSVIFGIFLSMIPNMLNESCVLGRNGASLVSVAVLILGFLVSWYLGDIQTHNAWLKARINQRNRG